ncbi:amidohydrolase family protein [Rhodococcus wratislaviensis]|uniref:amidohydrolase family protein n=1 Tax=Rhodococcus wratislaviensis TaxID=44752 RepID=UPI0036586BA6
MSKYEFGIDFEKINIVDFHAHVQTDSHGHDGLEPELLDAADQYFDPRDYPMRIKVDEVAAHYRERNMAAVVFTVDAYSASGHVANSVTEIAEGAARNNDVLIPFGSVDPWQGKGAVEQATKLINEFGVRGFKFHPSMQAFEPNDPRFYPLYEVIASAGLPALFHTGLTGIGAGMPGGHGIKIKYSNPVLLDDVAADFPTMKIVLAHPSIPWVDEQIAIAKHKSNVYIEISGWSAPSFPAQLLKEANTTLRHKVLFGSDFPVIDTDKWVDDFRSLGVDEAADPLIFKQNARRVLGI